MALNNLRLASIAKAGTPGKHTDEQGLYLRITPKGGMYWQWRIRTPHETVVSYGTYPEVSLAEARERHRQARELRRQGTHPNLAKRKAKLEQKLSLSNTFEAIAREWYAAKSPSWASEYAAKVMARLEADVFPRIGRLPILEITPLMMLDTIRKIQARGVHETAARVVDTCSQIFRFAMITGRAPINAAAGLRDALKAPPPTRHMAAITEPDRLGQLLRMIKGYQGGYVVRAALQLAPMLMLRPGELRKGRWTEVDLDNATWTVASSRMKRTKEGKVNGSPHVVPLPHQAVTIMRDLFEVTGGGELMFPGERSKDRPISENTVNAGLRALGIDTRREQTGHGFRATARTLLAEKLGFDDNVIEAQLAHQVKDELGRAYNRTKFIAQRKAMLQAWADYLDTLRNQPSAPSNVVLAQFGAPTDRLAA